jgi:hypothetical protein
MWLFRIFSCDRLVSQGPKVNKLFETGSAGNDIFNQDPRANSVFQELFARFFVFLSKRWAREKPDCRYN